MAHFGANHLVDNFQDSFSHPFKNRWGNFSQVFRTPQKNSHRISVSFSSSDGFETNRWQFLVEEIILKVGLPEQLLTRGPEGTSERIRAFDVPSSLETDFLYR